MGIISSSNSSGSSASTSTTASSNVNSQLTTQLGPDAFLSLLTTQLSNQDPLNPMDDTQSIAELAQFSQLQSSQNLASSFTSFQANNAITQSASLLGKTVTVSTASASVSGNANTSTVTGTISGITVANGVPSFSIKDSSGNLVTDSNGAAEEFTTSQILGISS